ncbi:P-loop NTPase fold protein [Actinophytocola sp. KF-1]
MFANLVTSRTLVPPVSIGLFGSWGTGKSFFMRELRSRVSALASAAADAERAAGRRVSPDCASVRQITFNAWHYREANLWASLATHIFDSLATGGSEDDLRRRADELAELRRTEDSLLTQLSAVRLERMVVAARHERRPVRLGLTADDLAWIAEETGVDKATSTHVRQFVNETAGLPTEVRRTWELLRYNRSAWLTLAVGVIVTAALVVLVGGPLWPAIAGAASLVAAVTPAIGRVRRAMDRIRDAAQRSDAATDQRLADLDAEAERLERTVTELASSHDATAFAQRAGEDYRGHLGMVSLLRRDLETFAAILTKEDGGLERVVLYIDDLDRCPVDVVIKVLEAIHLLAALPVFVVVVGVDAGWLRRAVTEHYATVLENGSATHYLEKIFQIPFQMAPMSSAGYRALLAGLAGPARAELVAPDLSGPAPAGSPPEPRPAQMEISTAELAFMAQLRGLVSSPRAAKRLVNLYRLVRARVPDTELDAFCDGEASRAVQILLAVNAHPASAALATMIDAAPDDVAWQPLLADGHDDPALSPLCALLDEIPDAPQNLAIYREWLPLVRRFTFADTI